MRFSRLVAGAVAVLAFAASPLLPQAHGASVSAAVATTATVTKQISPIDEHNQLADGYTIKHRYSNANCESGSPTTGSSYLCFTPQSAQGIFNSCWIQTNAHFALCLEKPWSHDVSRLHVTRGYGDSGGFPNVKRPWGIRLADGNRCLVIIGPVHTVRGSRVNYYCQHKVALAGSINDRHDTWTVSGFRKVKHHGRSTTFKSIGTQQIAISWSGGPSQKA